MKALKVVFTVMTMMGCIGIPGAIEFGSWIPTLVALGIGSAGLFILSRYA